MFDYNLLNHPEPFHFYLCKPNGEMICQLNGIDETTASITINLNKQYELSFDYFRYINSEDGGQTESNGYHDLTTGMTILADKIGYFKIKYPPTKFDGNKETKTITAASIDCELEDKDLVAFKVNTGEKDSLEYLVTYKDGETESLINDYTGLPYDYIVFYNTYPEQLKKLQDKYKNTTDGYIEKNDSALMELKRFCDLIPRLKRKIVTNTEKDASVTEYVTFSYDSSGKNITGARLNGFKERIAQLITFYKTYRDQLSLLSLATEKCNCNWTIGSVDDSLANKKFQFNIEGENIYSFLTNDVSSAAHCIFSFNLFKREIDVVLAENIGKDSGVIIDRQNLLNSLEISCNRENIYTRYNVSGGNKIDIKYVNFGSTRITDLSYFINARNESGKRIYVSDSLAEKYKQYVIDREIARESYISYTRQYNQMLTDINTLKYRVPNDNLKNNWDSFTTEELEDSLTSYNQLLATLQSLYKEDYGNEGCDSEGSIKESFIRTTEYWYDYYAYTVIILQIKQVLNARGENTNPDTPSAAAYTISNRNVNAASDTDTNTMTIIQDIHAYETEWSLYGTVELENKITAYSHSMQSFIDSESILLKKDSQEAKPWHDLVDSEKSSYGYNEINYGYSAYMNLYNEKTSCQTYLNELYKQLSALEISLNDIQARRNQISRLAELESYNRLALGTLVELPASTLPDGFTPEEIKVIHLLYADKNYSNEYILTTSLDTTVSEIDVQNELLADAKEQLSIDSQPQISFHADIENILTMQEFKDFNFTIGNYVTLEYYDDYYVNMRLVSMTFNPCIPNNSLSVSFSNFIKSRTERTDMTDILGLAVGGSGSSGGGSGGSSGIFGSGSDIDVTISNTMLSKLLNVEMFGTRVNNLVLDTVTVNKLTSKYTAFDGLGTGSTKIDGKCITTGYIINNLYNGKGGGINNTTGSVINFETGCFNLDGGKIIFNIDKDNNKSVLSVNGSIHADTQYTVGETTLKNDGTGQIGNWHITADAIYWKNNFLGNEDGLYFGTSGLSINNIFKVSSDGTMWLTDKFMVTSSNALTSAQAILKGDITANTLTVETLTADAGGQIANFHISADALYTENATLDNTTGIYFGKGGLRLGSKFKISEQGDITSSGALSIADGNMTYDSETGLAVTGNVGAASGVFTGNIQAANGVFSGNINAASVITTGIGNGIAAIGFNASSIILGGDTTINGSTSIGSNTSIGGNVSISGSINGNLKIYQNNYQNTVIDTVERNLTLRDIVVIDDDCFRPESQKNNKIRLGSNTIRWKEIWCNQSGINSTSDRNLKNTIRYMKEQDNIDNFFLSLAPCTYKFNDGESGRTHFGFISQDVEQALFDNHMTAYDFAGFCKDEKTETYLNEDNEECTRAVLTESGEKEYSYSLRYGEFIALNTYMLQKAFSRITELENKLKQMKSSKTNETI